MRSRQLEEMGDAEGYFQIRRDFFERFDLDQDAGNQQNWVILPDIESFFLLSGGPQTGPYRERPTLRISAGEWHSSSVVIDGYFPRRKFWSPANKSSGKGRELCVTAEDIPDRQKIPLRACEFCDSAIKLNSVATAEIPYNGTAFIPLQSDANAKQTYAIISHKRN